jgi:hypothetical protein
MAFRQGPRRHLGRDANTVKNILKEKKSKGCKNVREYNKFNQNNQDVSHMFNAPTNDYELDEDGIIKIYPHPKEADYLLLDNDIMNIPKDSPCYDLFINIEYSHLSIVERLELLNHNTLAYMMKHKTRRSKLISVLIESSRYEEAKHLLSISGTNFGLKSLKGYDINLQWPLNIDNDKELYNSLSLKLSTISKTVTLTELPEGRKFKRSDVDRIFKMRNIEVLQECLEKYSPHIIDKLQKYYEYNTAVSDEAYYLFNEIINGSEARFRLSPRNRLHSMQKKKNMVFNGKISAEEMARLCGSFTYPSKADIQEGRISKEYVSAHSYPSYKYYKYTPITEMPLKDVIFILDSGVDVLPMIERHYILISNAELSDICSDDIMEEIGSIIDAKLKQIHFLTCTNDACRLKQSSRRMMKRAY